MAGPPERQGYPNGRTTDQHVDHGRWVVMNEESRSFKRRWIITSMVAQVSLWFDEMTINDSAAISSSLINIEPGK